MDIKDLDEYQGLTAEMVRNYLERTGWTGKEIMSDGTCDYRSPRPLLNANGVPARILVLTVRAGCESSVCNGISAYEGRPIQSLLREINPRLRKGKPSPEARLAHSKNGGVWIATHGELGNDGSIVFASFDESRLVLWNGEGWDYPDTELTETLPEWSFWPCDAAGNKVRWPERDGVML